MIVVIGGGVAGLSCALAAVEAAAEGGRSARTGTRTEVPVELIVAGPPNTGAPAAVDCNTALAQGGISAAIGAGDSPAAHLADTIAAGGGLVDAEAAEALVTDGAAAMLTLLQQGLAADRDGDGRLKLGLEAAHSAARIVHAGGDRTGAVLHADLWKRARAAERAGRLVIRGPLAAVSLIEDAGVIAGVVLRDPDGVLSVRSADAVVLATGGYAALYPRTSNHAGAKGEGIVLAAHAGALVADLEFVQFHPTVLEGTGQLISEAVRGAGAVLRDGSGKRFMTEYDPRAELAPRDLVSRAIHRTLRDRGGAAVWLDASGIEAEEGAGSLTRRFPGITAMLAARGYDWTREAVPVSPAAHYTMGGIVSDLDGRSTVPGLYVAGEVASTGVHGANRLASNSLLEGMVFGERAGRAAASWALAGGLRGSDWTLRGVGSASLASSAQTERLDAALVADVSAADSDQTATGQAATGQAATGQTSSDRMVAEAVAAGLGIERDAEGLRAAGEVFQRHGGPHAELAWMLQRSAQARSESRGAHQRADHPEPDATQAARRAFRFERSAAPVAAGSITISTGTPAICAPDVPGTESSAIRSIQGSLTSC